jgi:phospholipid transport system substrate-binding protein
MLNANKPYRRWIAGFLFLGFYIPTPDTFVGIQASGTQDVNTSKRLEKKGPDKNQSGRDGKKNRSDQNGDNNLKEEEVKKFIENIGAQVVKILSQDRGKDKTAFQALFEKYFHIPGMAKRVLGRKIWKEASREEKSEYLEKFQKDMVNTYVDIFHKYYTDQVLQVTGAESKGKGFRVHSQIMSKQSKIPVMWHVKEIGDVLKVVDVLVEGGSITRAKSHDYRALAKNGIKDLLQALGKKNTDSSSEKK